MRKPTIGPRTHRLICVGDVVGPGGKKIQEFQQEFDLTDLPPRLQVFTFGGSEENTVAPLVTRSRHSV